MTETAAATSGPTDTINFSNVTVVRDIEGKLTVWCGGEKILGVIATTISDNILNMALPMNRVRLAEGLPATPVSANVIEFKNFRKAQATLVVDNTAEPPLSDGDAQ